MSVAIRITDMNFRYPGSETLALSSVHLEILKGECLGLLGPNGAGKSTLISFVCGEKKDSTQNITIFEKKRDSIFNIGEIIGYAPQELAIQPKLTGLENLDFFTNFYSLSSIQKKQRISYAIEKSQLENFINKKAEKYSGGLKRRLNFAISLLGDPEILVFDEPTVGIDPESRNLILTEVKKLNNEGKTIIYSSHYMEEIKKICTTLAVLNNGKVFYKGDVNGFSKSGDLESSLLKMTNDEKNI